LEVLQDRRCSWVKRYQWDRTKHLEVALEVAVRRDLVRQRPRFRQVAQPAPRLFLITHHRRGHLSRRNAVEALAEALRRHTPAFEHA